jgi:hypothetical protein
MKNAFVLTVSQIEIDEHIPKLSKKYLEEHGVRYRGKVVVREDLWQRFGYLKGNKIFDRLFNKRFDHLFKKAND